jgi:disulfide bond formation protein DsbB
MKTEPTSSRGYAFPVLTAVVLFAVFGILLGVLLNEANLVHRTQDAFPQVTPIPPTEVAAVASPAPEETPLVELTVAPEVSDANAAVDIAPVDAGSEGVVLDPALIAEGQTAFSTVCTACHGLNAQGIQGLGKDLVTSEFVNSLSDADLAHFIITGREITDPLNTTGVAMPARGGNPAMTDQQIDAIVVYLRSLAADAGVQPIHTGQNTDIAAANPADQPTEAAPAPTRDPSIVAEPWTAPVPVSGAYIAVEDMPADVQALYRWADEGVTAGAPYGPEVFDSSLLAPGSEAALNDYLVNQTGYLDQRTDLPFPIFGGDRSLPAPEGE